MKKRILFIVLGVLFCVVALGFYFGSLFALSDMCETTIHSSAISPNQQCIATVYDIDCGAATRFNRQINLQPNGTDFNTDLENRVFWASGDSNITLIWLTDTKLKVIISGDVEDINQQSTKWHGIYIEYQCKTDIAKRSPEIAR